MAMNLSTDMIVIVSTLDVTAKTEQSKQKIREILKNIKFFFSAAACSIYSQFALMNYYTYYAIITLSKELLVNVQITPLKISNSYIYDAISNIYAQFVQIKDD